MSRDQSESRINRRNVLRATGATLGGGLVVSASGTAAASSMGHGQGSGSGNPNGCGQSSERGQGRGAEKCASVQEISSEGDTIITLVQVFGEKFLFREAAAYRNADDASTQSTDITYEATRSGHPVEFQKIDSSVSASDLQSDGTISTQQVDFTPENFIEDYDVDFKQICNGCCDDIVWNSHHAIEFHFQGGGAFSSIGVAGIASVLCWAAAASTSIPTGGLSGAAAAGLCGMFTTAVDQLIDVEMIPNKAEMSMAFWDQDETNFWGWYTSPTIAVGLASDSEDDYDDMEKIGEYDNNIHLGF